MKKVARYRKIAQLFEYKTVRDNQGNEFVFFSNSNINNVDEVNDKTELEALENHVHLINHIKKKEFGELIPVAQSLGKSLLRNLQAEFPDKKFCVFVSLLLHDSMIIRFHQLWDNEPPYYNPSEFNSDTEKVFEFRN